MKSVLRIGSLFSGIGGLELGLEWSGLGRTVWQVEQSQYCRDVLARHWPGVAQYDDVCTVGRRNLGPVDLICGGFPCQDVSAAGLGVGLAGARSGLWYEFARVLADLRPEWVVVENVASGSKRWVDAVRGDLGRLGYETLPVPLSASDCGAPHRRARIFLVGRLSDRDGFRRGQGQWSQSGRTSEEEPEARGRATDARNHGGWASAPRVPRVVYGLPSRVDRAKALGNAVVPECAEVIGHIINLLRKEAP